MLCVRGNCLGMARFFEGSHVKLMQSILSISEVDDHELSQPPFKLPRKEKQLRVLVESIHLSTVAQSTIIILPSIPRRRKMSHNWYQHWCGRPSMHNIGYHLDNIFQEDTLEDWLWDALKELKTKTSNKDGSEKVVLQNENVLT